MRGLEKPAGGFLSWFEETVYEHRRIIAHQFVNGGAILPREAAAEFITPSWLTRSCQDGSGAFERNSSDRCFEKTGSASRL
jgi:hypothetical protein